MGRKPKENVLYMAIDKPPLELPLAVAGSVSELAELQQIGTYTIYKQLRLQREGKRAKYIEVQIKERR